MKIGLGILAAGGALALASGALAEPQTLLKCDGALPMGQRYTVKGGWQPFPNPDKAVTVIRDKGKLTITVEGGQPFTTQLVFALPQVGTKTFKVLGQNGVERFQLFESATPGRPELRHTITGGSDGSHVYNIRVTTLGACSVVSPDVAVQKPAPAGAAAER